MSERNMLAKKIDEAIQRSGFDENFIEAIKAHLGVLQKYSSSPGDIQSEKNLCDVLLSKLFLDNLDIYPNKRFASQLDENFEWDFEIVPSEVFAEEKLPEDFRRTTFFECLNLADVLDCKVATILATEYELQVITKYGSARLLSDLNITVKLPMITSEMALLKIPLNIGDFVRVAILMIDADDKRIIKVTLDENTLQFSKKYIQLGRVKEEKLPLYLRDQNAFNNFKTLTDYLNNCPGFQNPSSLDNILTGFGLDDKRVYSFYPNLDSSIRNCPDECTGQGLLKAARYKDLKNFLCLAANEHASGNLQKTLDAITLALEYDPKCPEAFEIRAKAYTELDKDKTAISRKALLDFEVAYELDKNNETAKQNLMKTLLKAAVKFCKQKKYAKALQACEEAAVLNDNFPETNFLLGKLKACRKKGVVEALKAMNLNETEETPETVLGRIENPFKLVVVKKEKNPLEQATLTDLQMKKKALVTELNQFV